MNKLFSPDNPHRSLLKLKPLPGKLVQFLNVLILFVLCPAIQAQTQQGRPAHSDGVMASMFSGTGLLIMLGLMCGALLVVRLVRPRSDTDDDLIDTHSEQPTTSKVRLTVTNRRAKVPSATTVKPPPVAFGAYRIKQEVAKVVLGHPHRVEVLASRAPEDMRAIEAALLNFVNSPESTDEERRRAREALERYGFIARYCAALLRAADPFERTSAARSLGQIGSTSALPFLLDSLYDQESIVRNQAIESIGELKNPEAMDALRDVARVCPDLPAHLVRRALNGNSAEGTGFNPHVLGITELKPPSKVEDLPAASDDKRWLAAMTKLTSEVTEERAEAVKVLGDFPVQKSVVSLTKTVRDDTQPNVRSLAVASLADINHESVFPAMLLAMADVSREVRASAARSMSRLSFDRSGAYVRLLVSSDRESLKEFASACVSAGIVAQNVERLASSDRRQVYEAFCLISLLAKAQQAETLIDAIASHENVQVRLSLIHLLATTGQPHISEELQRIASRDDVPEEVKTALLEAMYKLAQSQANPNADTIEQSV